MADTNFIPPVGFHFKVEIMGLSFVEPIGFQEVKGLSFDIQTEDITDGGDPIPWKVPNSVRYPNLILKRGFVNEGSFLLSWCQTTIVNGYYLNVVALPLSIKLLNKKGEEIAYWFVEHAYPVKYELSEFNAEQSAFVFETIELCYKRYYDAQALDMFNMLPIPLPF